MLSEHVATCRLGSGVNAEIHLFGTPAAENLLDSPSSEEILRCLASILDLLQDLLALGLSLVLEQETTRIPGLVADIAKVELAADHGDSETFSEIGLWRLVDVLDVLQELLLFGGAQLSEVEASERQSLGSGVLVEGEGVADLVEALATEIGLRSLTAGRDSFQLDLLRGSVLPPEFKTTACEPRGWCVSGCRIGLDSKTCRGDNFLDGPASEIVLRSLSRGFEALQDGILLHSSRGSKSLTTDREG